MTMFRNHFLFMSAIVLALTLTGFATKAFYGVNARPPQFQCYSFHVTSSNQPANDKHSEGCAGAVGLRQIAPDL